MLRSCTLYDNLLLLVVAKKSAFFGRINGGKAEIVEKIEKLTLLEAVELKKALEDKFGVTAAAPVVMAAGMPSAGGAAPAAEEKTEFTVLLKEAGATDIRFLCLLAAPEGVARMKEAHPDVPVVTAALDERLNAQGYIVPGLGDAGDRMYGTK